MKVLYIFSGTRTDRFKGKISVDYPDTQFYGMNHLNEFGIDAEYKEFESYPFGRLIKKIIGFRLKNALMYFPARRYDLVFGISVFYMLIWKKIFRTETKFVVFNSMFNRMLTVHPDGSLRRRILFWILQDVDGIVFLGRDQLERMVKAAPFLRSKSYFVPMGVDAAYYHPMYDGRKSFFLSVGRDNARDYGTLVEAARLMPDEEFHFVCLPRNIADIEDIPPNIKIHINIPFGELQDLYRTARALLLIMHDDSHIEGSDSSGPTVLLEAMAIGMPIVVSKKGYIADYLEDGKNALFVDFYDTNGIVKAVKAISDAAYRMKLAQNARAKVDECFNTREMARGLAEVFEKIHGRN